MRSAQLSSGQNSQKTGEVRKGLVVRDPGNQLGGDALPETDRVEKMKSEL